MASFTIGKYDLTALQSYHPCCWLNEDVAQHIPEQLPLQIDHLNDAQQRWKDLRPVLSSLFPEQSPLGTIQSPLRRASNTFRGMLGLPASCTLLIKEDSKLAVCGSVKARGGLYETFVFAQKINNDWSLDADNKTPLLDAIKEGLMEDYRVIVGSTGNLGLSVGLAASSMGMKSTVHMSKDAKEWKKILLRERGSNVEEHAGSYGVAVAEGRRSAETDAFAHFVDDEQSKTLFLGYACAAFELYDQLEEMEIDKEQQIVVHIPCGVGGAPSGICWGLKHVFGNRVAVFFAEPTHAPCVLLAMGSETKSEPPAITTCSHLGLDVLTDADGLACGKASPLCLTMMEHLVEGIYTVDDEQLFVRLNQLVEIEGEDAFMEPSCCASLEGPRHLAWMAEHASEEQTRNKCAQMLENTIHIMWSTGGSLVPMEERKKFCERGDKLS